MTIRIGSVGFGRHFRRSLLPNLVGVESFTLVAVAERDPALREQARERFPGLIVLADAAELFALDGLDAVIISTNPASHVDLTCAALDAGLHVFVEKPLGTSAGQIDGVADLAEQRGLLVMTGTMWRHAPAHKVLTDWLRTAAAHPRLVSVSVTFPAVFERAGWNMSALQLAFYDMFIHPVDWVCHLIGPVGTTDAVRLPGIDPSAIVVNLRLWSADGSALACINAATGSHAYQVNAWLHTDRGDLVEVDAKDRLRLTTQPTWSGTEGSIRDRATLNWEAGQLYRGWARKGYAEELAAFAARIRTGQQSRAVDAADLRHASATMRVIEDCLKQTSSPKPAGGPSSADRR